MAVARDMTGGCFLGWGQGLQRSRQSLCSVLHGRPLAIAQCDAYNEAGFCQPHPGCWNAMCYDRACIHFVE